MLAAARKSDAGETGEKSAEEPSAAEKPATEKPLAAKPKPAAKAKPAAEAKPAAQAKPGAGAPKDTASILAAARKTEKPGPMTKADAAAKAGKEGPAKQKAAKAKAKLTVPPMPTKPDYAKAKPAYAKGKPAKAKAGTEDRRGILNVLFGSALGVGFTSLAAANGLWGLATARFMFPNVLIEPPSRVKVGFPADFPQGQVATKFKAQFGIWVVKGEYDGQQQIYALKTVCTHLGCTPNWLDAEQKFKCPCHGSGFYADGINFEGPAPRPLERYAIKISEDGQLEVDKSKVFMQEKGEWSDPASFVPV